MLGKELSRILEDIQLCKLLLSYTLWFPNRTTAGPPLLTMATAAISRSTEH